mmetsp:Transcript_105166/g.181344  ORF Transcript_105166/g.181344 Transcript_105166/m.181344 type:complete len:149 (-) Transcript_105166:333-779(-)
MSTTNALCTLDATTANGFSDPSYSTHFPSALAASGVTPQAWSEFIKEANKAVAYQWCPSCALWALCCFLPFFCNRHNKNRRAPMKALCQRWNSCPDFSTVHVEYSMVTEKVLVHAVGKPGAGATLETYHRLVFSRRSPGLGAQKVDGL